METIAAVVIVKPNQGDPARKRNHECSSAKSPAAPSRFAQKPALPTEKHEFGITGN